MDGKKIARGLGWFSIGLGLTEVAAPERLNKFLGVENHAGLVRAFGLREMAAGAGLLTQSQLAPWMWARVGGDALDLAALCAAYATPGARRSRIGLVAVAVAPIVVLDIICARELSGG